MHIDLETRHTINKNCDPSIQMAIEIIKEFEGLSLKPYVCPAGILTIGYGHVIRKEEKFPAHFSSQDAECLLYADVRKFSVQVLRLVPAHRLRKNQIAALISFAFNVGYYALYASTLRRKMIREDNLLSIASEFDRWVYARGRKLKGLVRRRQREKQLFLQRQGKKFISKNVC